jgi:hypothetical protein
MTINNNYSFSCISINSLEEISFIAGDHFVLTFTVFDENGDLVNLNGAVAKWVLSIYGNTSIAILQKTGVLTDPTNGVFTVTLLYNDTFTLGGKYIQQPVITDYSGKIFRPGQGIVTIVKAIPYT